MDYIGIINLAVVTIFFSTIIAPSLKKISDIKDQIISVAFPIIDSIYLGEENKKAIVAKGIDLNKKITRYDDKYRETKSFLGSFYLILLILAAIQFAVLYSANALWGQGGLLFLGSLVVVAIVIYLVNSYMTDPAVVRSIQWLAAKGISEAHTKQLYNPKLILNGRLSNVKPHDNKTTIAIRSSIDLNGYGYMLIVESDDYTKLYALNTGFIGNILSKTTISSSKGESGTEIELFNFRLNPGKYRARLLFLSQAYSGNYAPGETMVEFEVGKDSQAQTQSKNIEVAGNSNGYIFTVANKKNKQKIVHMESDQRFEGDKNVSFILNSERLLKYLSKGYRPVVFYSKNGDIDRYDLHRYLFLLRVIKRRLHRRLKNMIYTKNIFLPAKGFLILLARNPKSRMRSSK